MPLNQTQRPKFYEEQYLGAADLTAAVDYGRVQQARHALGAHTWGIAIGLQLKETPQLGGAVSVHLLPGYAWDGYGRPIVVLSPYKIPEEKFSAIKFDAAIDTGDGEKGRLIPVWLRYDESATQNPRPGFEVCETADQRSRIQETFRIEIGEPGTTDRYTRVTVGTKSLIDAKTALRAFDPTAPLVYDESIPQQTFPESQDRARWLIPIGYVRWLPVQNQPGHFVARDDKGAGGQPKDSDQIRIFRRYIGVVAETIEAADGRIRLKHRGEDLAPVRSNDNDLVWVEGNLRIEGDVRLFNHQLDFRDSTGRKGQDDKIPLAIQRRDSGSSGHLQVVIGQSDNDANAFTVGPQPAGATTVSEKFVVLGSGNVGVGTTSPRAALEVTTNKLTAQNQAVVGLFRRGAKEPADNLERSRFIIEGGTDTTSPSLDLRSNDPTGNTRGTHLYYVPPQWANVPEHFGIWTHGRGTAFSIHSANNHVGIGTISPAGKLTIEDAGHINVLIDRTGQDHMTFTVGTIGTGIHFGDGKRFFISADPYSERNTLGFGNEVFTILPNGHVGIGTNTPAYRLDVAHRMRVRQGSDQSAGIWFAQNGPNPNRAFVGMADDNRVGFYGGTGAQWGLAMDTTSGNVGIGVGGGTISPTLKLDIQGNFGRDNGPAIAHLWGSHIGDSGGGILFLRSGGGIVTFDGNDNVGIGTRNPQNLLDVNGDASKPTGPFWTASSDLRLKKDVAPVTDALHNLLRLRGVQFHWKEPEKMGNLTGVQMGLVAQETEAVFPQWISTGRDGYKQITIRGFEALTIEALRELHTEIEALKIHLDKPTESHPAVDTRPRQRRSRKEATHETRN